jgi:hypothetical protein
VGTFLREQAAQLGRKTDELVQAEVVTDVDPTSSGDDRLAYRFFLKAPKLGNYRYLLFKARPYDASSSFPLEIIHEGQIEVLGSQNQLATKLRQVFSAESTKNVIKTLISESQQA